MTFASKTAERINSMTPMEILDFVENAIVEQGKSAVFMDESGNVACAYRGKDGTKCAFGIIIDDADYHKSFEGARAWDVTDRLGIYDRVKRQLFQRLQYAHDNAHRDVSTGYDVSFVDAFKSKVLHTRNWLLAGAEPNALYEE
jgi:hypothetical protein